MRSLTWSIAVAGVLLATPAFAQDKSQKPTAFAVNAELAKTGEKVWAVKGCLACHTIGKNTVTAPDLNGLFKRRNLGWIKSWLKDPDAMLESDATAKAMLEEYNGLRMPNMGLTEEEIDAVMHYIASQQKTTK